MMAMVSFSGSRCPLPPKRIAAMTNEMVRAQVGLSRPPPAFPPAGSVVPHFMPQVRHKVGPLHQVLAPNVSRLCTAECALLFFVDLMRARRKHLGLDPPRQLRTAGDLPRSGKSFQVAVEQVKAALVVPDQVQL